jgi:hypothetical protein
MQLCLMTIWLCKLFYSSLTSSSKDFSLESGILKSFKELSREFFFFKDFSKESWDFKHLDKDICSTH